MGSNITDWLMVVITGVYVIATFLICKANWDAANASKEQLAEMRKQYEEENRPCSEVEFLYEKRAFYGLRFINHGKQTAQHVIIQLDNSFLDSLTESNFARMLRDQVGKECVIGVGQHYDLFFGTQEYRSNPNKVPATGKIFYQSNGNEYTSDFCVNMENYATIFSVHSEQEDIKEALKKQAKELEGIKRVLQSALTIKENTDE